MAQDFTNFDAAFKDDYQIGLRNGVNNSNIILTDCVQRNPYPIRGRKAKWSFHFGRPGSTAFRGEGDTLPTAANEQYEDPEQVVTYSVYHPIKVSGQVIEASSTDSGAFEDALEGEVMGGEKNIKNTVCRALFGQATVQSGTATVYRTGKLAAVTSIGAAPTLAVANATAAEMRYFHKNMRLDAVTPGTGVVTASAMTVSSVDKAGKTVTVADATGVLANDILVVSGSYNKEFPGLRVLINDPTGDKIDGSNTALIHGLSSASVDEWSSVKVGSTSTPISERLLNSAFDKIITDGNGEDLSSRGMVIVSYDQLNELADQLQVQKRYEGREVTLKSGWRGLKLARGTLFADRYCPDNDGFVIDPEELGWFVLKDFGWDEIDGRRYLRSSTDAVEARLKGYVSPAALTRNSHARIAFAAVSGA